MKKIIPILFLFITTSLFATTYYVKNGGNDNLDGRTINTAWATLTKVNGTLFNPGDSILFACGNTWRGVINVTRSGSLNNHIVYSSYGTGNKPKFIGSSKASTWNSTAYPNVWQCNVTGLTDPSTIGWASESFVEVTENNAMWGNRRTYTSNLSNLTAEFDWTWSGNVMYLYAQTDPDTRYFSVEIPQEEVVVYLNDCQYVTFNNLRVHFAVEVGLGGYNRHPDEGAAYHGLRVTNCNIGWIGAKNGPFDYGIESFYSDAYIAFNEIHNSGRRNISLTTYGDYPGFNMSNVVIENNYFHHGYHTTGLDLNTTGAHHVWNVYFRNNVIQGEVTNYSGLTGSDACTNGVFVANQSGSNNGLIEYVYVYNNVITNSSGKAATFENVQNCWFVNNTVYGVNPTTSVWQGIIGVDCGDSGANSNINIFNNIIYNNDPVAAPSFYAFFCDNSNVYRPNMDNNLWYGTRTDTWMWELFTWTPNLTVYEYHMNEWSAFRTTYLLMEAHAPVPSDPQFNNAAVADFTLKSTSPAIGKGVPFSFVTTDILGHTRDATHPDLGAYEYQDETPIPAGKYMMRINGKYIRYNGKVVIFRQ